MAYTDGFLIPVPTKNLAAYRKMSQKAGVVWMEHGALDYKECAGEDMTAEGMTTTFPKAMKLKPDHTLVFSWIVYASKAERNRIIKLVMADPRLSAMMDPSKSPFDPKLMLYGGFDVIVDMAPAAKPKRTAKAKTPPKKTAKKKSRR
ncbi:MAG: DUF1428 domain-containing protein [Hyphomonadaceae bacterium]